MDPDPGSGLQALGCSPQAGGTQLRPHSALEKVWGHKGLSEPSSLFQGKGIEETYWLVGKAGFPRPLPTPLLIKPG